LSIIAPAKTIAVGIVAERSKGTGRWSDYLWRPVTALTGAPDTPVWTKLSDDGERASFFVGTTQIELYRSEAGNYRENLLVEQPLLWVALRPTSGDPPYALVGATVDPAEGESWVALGADLVDSVAMPRAVEAAVADFVAEHYVEQPFLKRKRDRANPEGMARRAPDGHNGKPQDRSS
jgi:Protein of unknown function (DUF3305)